MLLFEPDEQPLVKLLAEIQEPSPKFTLWIGATLRHTNGLQTTENILGALIESGLAADRKSGLQYLNNFCNAHSVSDLVIACSDLLGKSHTESFKKLEKSLGLCPVKKPADLARFFGMISHQAIHDLLTGQIPDYNLAQKLKYLVSETSFSVSPDLFGTGQKHTQDIFPDLQYIDGIRPDNRISDRLRQEITSLQTRVLSEFPQQDDPLVTLGKIKPALNELRAKLFPIFGSFINSCAKYDELGSESLLLSTLLSWAAAMSLIENEGCHTLFKEINVLSKNGKLGGGRMDALELMTIGGIRPNEWQTQLLKEMSRLHFVSSGRLMLSLEKKFGPNLAFKIHDWKFAVGDAEQIGHTIQPADLVQPLPKHLAQMRRYITLANLDYYQNGGNENAGLEDIWNLNSPVKSGRIVYFLASEQPLIHEIAMTPEEQRNCFVQEIVFPFNHAQRLAIIRNINNALSGHIINKLEGKTRTSEPVSTETKKPTPSNSCLDIPTRSISQIIEHHRYFTDENNIIEWIGNKNNRPVYLMHLNRLLETMHQGKVCGDFYLKRGRGFITCLMSDHEEHTPSLHIDIGRGMWKCFGCGVFGFFADESLTDKQGSDIKISYPRSTPREFNKTGKIIIPDEHNKIMTLAQEVLNNRFNKNDQALNYVAGRALDAELAHSLGTGYGDDELINVLLDSYDYDQLIHYGFLGISSKVSSAGGICPLLIERGMGLDQMKRQANTQFGLPYSVLAKRITFPLALEGRLTNFYGRATWQCAERSKHRKLSVEHTGVPHGAFNIQLLDSDSDYPEIVIAEGAFDALSLIQMGYPATMAIIGVNNQVILESIARSGKNLALAFDEDKNKYQTGQTNTQKITAKLKAMNYPDQIRNFTEDFITEHPDFLTAGKDFSDYLKYLSTKTA